MFLVPVLYGDDATQELNAFIASHRVAHVERKWIDQAALQRCKTFGPNTSRNEVGGGGSPSPKSSLVISHHQRLSVVHSVFTFRLVLISGSLPGCSARWDSDCFPEITGGELHKLEISILVKNT